MKETNTKSIHQYELIEKKMIAIGTFQVNGNTV